MVAITYNNYLRNIIGLGTLLRADVVKTHGLDAFTTLCEFEDDDIKTMMNGIRKDPDSPIPISALIEKRVKLACYGAQLFTMIGRPVNGQILSLRRLKQIDIHRHITKEHKDPKDEMTKVSRSYSIDKALDELPTYLRSIIGVRGVALSYVVRENETPPALQPEGPDLPYATASGSLMNELITNTPHSGGGWEEDNARVYGILVEMVKDVPMASSLKRHQRDRNGRKAYLSLVQHHLGSAQWDKIILKAEEIQNSRVWNGKNSRYTLRRHIDMHRDAYNDMVRANDHVSYEAPNERTRVTRLLRSIQANHIASIAAAKTTIEATPIKRDDFEEAADFLILNAPAQKSMPNDQRISAVDTNDKDGIEDRFYTIDEYRSLSNNQKYKLKLLREGRGEEAGKQGGNNGGNGGGGSKKTKRRNMNQKKKFKRMKSENDEMKQRIAALESGKSNDSNGDTSNKEKVVEFNQRNKNK